MGSNGIWKVVVSYCPYLTCSLESEQGNVTVLTNPGLLWQEWSRAVQDGFCGAARGGCAVTSRGWRWVGSSCRVHRSQNNECWMESFFKNNNNKKKCALNMEKKPVNAGPVQQWFICNIYLYGFAIPSIDTIQQRYSWTEPRVSRRSCPSVLGHFYILAREGDLCFFSVFPR